MSIVRMCIAAILFVFLITPAFADSPKMLFVEYKLIHPSIKEGTFEATSKKVWRIGFRYLRIEEAADPAENLHILIISNAPNTYMIDRLTKSGKHIIDRAKNIDVHMSVFQNVDLPEEIQKLEMGDENAFFNRHNATLAGTQTIEGIECNVYKTTISGIQLTLYKRKDNENPLQIGIKQENAITYDIRYLQYKPDLTPDLKLFEVPSGINLIDAN